MVHAASPRWLGGLVVALASALCWAAEPIAQADAPSTPATAEAPGAGGETPVAAPAPAPTTGEATAEPVPAAVQPAVPAVAQPSPRPDPIRLDPPRADALRPSLLPLAQPLWSELGAVQQRVLEPFAAQWNALPVSEKRAWADLASRFPKMKPEERKRVEKRIAEWAALTPEQRRLARANYRLAQQVARENVLAEWESYQAMTPEQRSVLGTAGSTSNTAARHAGASTGLAKEAAQPLPRRAPKPAVANGSGPPQVPVGSVTPTVGPAGASRP
jgi:hypothetical protein